VILRSMRGEPPQPQITFDKTFSSGVEGGKVVGG
jgi:hypothetical protein